MPGFQDHYAAARAAGLNVDEAIGSAFDSLWAEAFRVLDELAPNEEPHPTIEEIVAQRDAS